MIPINKFTLQEHKGEYEDWPLKTSLLYGGEATGTKVPGYFIEKQFELTHYFLLLTSWDCPFEEACEVVVLNKLFKIVGRYSFSAAYCSYLLRDFVEMSKDRYELTFYESCKYELIINYPKRYFFTKVIKVNSIDSDS